MSRKDTHRVRGKRSRRRWKPTYKTIMNHYAKQRRAQNRFLRGIGPLATGEFATYR